MTDPIEQAAQALQIAARKRTPIPPFAASLGESAGLAEAYAVQDRITEAGLKAGRRLVGRKIGLTSAAVQAQMGVDQPDYGMLFADMEYADGGVVPWEALIQPRVEAEIAFVLDSDLMGDGITATDLMRAIAYAVPALEVVDSRVQDWTIGLLDTVADNASSGVYVLGSRPVLLDGVDLRLCGMVMERNGQAVSFGAGAACMGNPLVAALWLARKMSELDRPLQAGDVVLTGALGPMVSAAPGDAFAATIAGLGTVTTVFSNDKEAGA
jgi:2-keto-4-pentenoate hydratase